MRQHSRPIGTASALAAALTTLVACAAGAAAPNVAIEGAPASPATAQLAAELPDVIAAGHDGSADLVLPELARLPVQVAQGLVNAPDCAAGHQPSWRLFLLAPKTSPPRPNR